MKIDLLAAVAVSALALAGLSAGAAQADAVTWTSTAFDTGPAAGQTIVDDFDSAIAAGYTMTGGHLNQTPLIPGIAAPPAGDSTQYLAVYPTDPSAKFSSLVNLASLSVYLGSIDDYNTITFQENGTDVASFTGTQLLAVPPPPVAASGDQSDGANNRLFDFTFNAPVNDVVFSTTNYSFEFDNIAVQNAPGGTLGEPGGVPEPATWALMFLGVFGAGAALRASRNATGPALA